MISRDLQLFAGQMIGFCEFRHFFRRLINAENLKRLAAVPARKVRRLTLRLAGCIGFPLIQDIGASVANWCTNGSPHGELNYHLFLRCRCSSSRGMISTKLQGMWR